MKNKSTLTILFAISFLLQSCYGYKHLGNESNRNVNGEKIIIVNEAKISKQTSTISRITGWLLCIPFVIPGSIYQAIMWRDKKIDIDYANLNKWTKSYNKLNSSDIIAFKNNKQNYLVLLSPLQAKEKTDIIVNKNKSLGKYQINYLVGELVGEEMQKDIDNKKIAIEKEKIAEEQRIQKEKETKVENDRKYKVAKLESEYTNGLNKAKTRVNENPNWKFIEYSNGYYIGEIKNGKRDGYGEFYWKNTSISEDMNSKDISYLGAWENDEFNGNGKFNFSKRKITYSLFGVEIENYWIYYTSTCNFLNGTQEGEGTLSTKSYDSISYERLLYSNGKISRNYTQESKNKREKEDFQRWKVQNKITECKNCIINEEKTTFPHEGGFLIFTYDEPGEIVMKNGVKYEFYYKEGEKPWYIIDSHGIIFDDTTDFASFDEMITELIKRCIEKKCK